MLEIALNPGVSGGRRLRLRTLEGRDELNLDPHGRTGFCDFVEALAVKAEDGDPAPGGSASCRSVLGDRRGAPQRVLRGARREPAEV